MKNILILFLTIAFIACQKNNKDQAGVIISCQENQISDSVFLNTLNAYIEISTSNSKSRFVQIFSNYEQNLSRYIFFKTKYADDIYKRLPYDYFYYRNNVVLIYSGLEYLFKTNHSLPDDLEKYLNDTEFFSSSKKGNFSNQIGMGGNIWELKIYHSFKDSASLNKGYEGVFIWDASKIKVDTIVPFVKPIINK